MSDDCAHLLDTKGQIKPEMVEDLLVEVLSGKAVFESQGDLYASRPAILEEQGKARVVYARRVHDCKKKGVPTRAEIEVVALDQGFIEAEERAEQQGLERTMERQQKARENTRDHTQKLELATEIEKVRARLIELKLREEEVFVHSAETKAEEARTAFLVACCTMGGEMLDVPVWANWQAYKDSNQWALLVDSRRAFVRVLHGLPITIIRAIARSHAWRSRWKAARESGSPLLVGSAGDWGANQRNLAWWTDFYDAISRHPEAPAEETIQNDEALQDWINQQVSKKHQAGAPASSKPPPTYIDGHGNRQSMVRIGESHTKVNTPFRVRV